MAIIANPDVVTLDYDWLQARIIDWLHRDDLALQIPDFILLAEQRLNRLANVRTMQVEVPLSFAAGGRTAALPADFNQPIAVWLELPQGRGKLTPTVVELLPVSVFARQPRYWTIDGSNLALDCPANTPYTVTLRYMAAFRLSPAYPVNTLLTNYPDLYLYGALLESAPYVRDPQTLTIWQDRFDRAVKEINANESRARAVAPLMTEIAGVLGRRTNNFTGGY